MHLTVGIFGDQTLAERLGKKGTVNDIAIYNHGSSEGVFTFVCPNSEKIVPLLQALNMIDVPVLVVNSLTKEIGEMIVGINEMNFEKGFIITGIGDSIQPLIKGTSLERFKIVDESGLRSELLHFEINRPGDQLLVPIDNCFKVKSVGTIVLGIVRSGKVKQFDKLFVEPLGKEVTIKGIQSQDRDIDEAEAGTRVGLNLKGVEADEIKRGYVVCNKIEKSSAVSIKFVKNKFYKQDVKTGSTAMLSIGLQVVACTIEQNNDELVLKTVNPVAYTKNQRCIIASTSEIMPRIIGSGLIAA
ncbi:MAG: EF-Tu/IF-2/RF-3 family GTPase [Candidatus Aenigmatarchaeota archaeon]